MTAPDHRHPTAKTYWLVALFLAVVTAMEVSIPYLTGIGALSAPLLIAAGIIKFAVVVAVFMHLRYDSPSLRFYFLIGVFGATIVFAVVLAAFRAF